MEEIWKEEKQEERFVGWLSWRWIDKDGTYDDRNIRSGGGFTIVVCYRLTKKNITC